MDCLTLLRTSESHCVSVYRSCTPDRYPHLCKGCDVAFEQLQDSASEHAGQYVWAMARLFHQRSEIPEMKIPQHWHMEQNSS